MKMSRESKYNTDLRTGSYNRPVHHGEVVNGSKVKNDAPSTLEQDLGAQEGISLAKRLFASRRDS